MGCKRAAAKDQDSQKNRSNSWLVSSYRIYCHTFIWHQRPDGDHRHPGNPLRHRSSADYGYEQAPAGKVLGLSTKQGKPRAERLGVFAMAVTVGFEPTVRFHAHNFSRVAPSAARTRHRDLA